MEAATSQESSGIRDAFVAAYRPYTAGVLAARRIAPPPGWEEAIVAGEGWLSRELEILLDQPMHEQRRSPLEVFQEALAFPTDAIALTGRRPDVRDPAARRALPGDVYDLAPPSSQALGEDAWKAHLAWGVAKAKHVAGAVPRPEAPAAGTASPSAAESVPRRPVAALVGVDVMDRSRIEPAVKAAGLRLEVWRNPAAIDAGLDGPLPVVVLVDLAHPAADDALRSASSAGVRTFAFGPHVDDIALVRAKSLGAQDALARSRFFRRLPELLPRAV